MSDQPPAWVATYIGLPWRPHGRDRSGLDCWGLVRLVHLEVFGLALDSHGEVYADATDPRDVGPAIAARRDPWPVPERPAVGDVVLVHRRGWPAHAGVHVARGRMLHIEEGPGSCVATYPSLRHLHCTVHRHPART